MKCHSPKSWVNIQRSASAVLVDPAIRRVVSLQGPAFPGSGRPATAATLAADRARARQRDISRVCDRCATWSPTRTRRISPVRQGSFRLYVALLGRGLVRIDTALSTAKSLP